jgi:hypothetical protein
VQDRSLKLHPTASGRQHPLLRLPAPADNAAMETEPTKADPPKRKRRRFQYRLRTLMIGVTLLAVPLGYVGWQAKIVRERKLLADEYRRSPNCYISTETNVENWPWRPMPHANPREVSWLRRLIGDEAIARIAFDRPISDAELFKLRDMFPEATIEK